MKITISGCNILPEECRLEKGLVVLETMEYWSVRMETGEWREPSYVINDGDNGALCIKTMRMPLSVAPMASNCIHVLELKTLRMENR